MRQEIKSLPLILLSISSLLVLPVFIYPSDWAGWLLIYFSFTLPLLFARIRNDRKLLTLFFIIIAIHNGVSIYNAYVSTVFGADLDAVTFHMVARDLATDKHPLWFIEFNTLEIGANAYAHFLALSYRIFGVSLLLGQELSIVAYTLSAIILIYTVSFLRLRYKRPILIVYGLSAPAIIYCSITMREAWQVLFFILILYLTLRLRTSPSFFKAFCIPLAGLALGLLHNGLFVYALVLVVWSLYWGASGKWKNAGYKKIAIRAGILVTAVTAFGVWVYLGGEIGGVSRAIRAGEVASYTETYRERGEQEASANYQVKVDTSTFSSTAFSGSLAFVYYQFAPFPWQVRRLIDTYAAFEALLRFILCVFMFRLWWKASGLRRSWYTYMIGCYLTLEVLWSLGTANWGTATRHHVVAYSILVLLGLPGLTHSLEQLLLRMKSQTASVSHTRRYAMKKLKVVN